MADPVAEHDARYGEEGAGPPEWSRVRDRWRPRLRGLGASWVLDKYAGPDSIRHLR